MGVKGVEVHLEGEILSPRGCLEQASCCATSVAKAHSVEQTLLLTLASARCCATSSSSSRSIPLPDSLAHGRHSSSG